MYVICSIDRLCDLVVRLPGCRPRGPEFDSQRCLSGLVRINEELLERKVGALV
jgi:hypothetical protein